MVRISSGGTFFWKRGFPGIWFGFIAVFACIVVVTATANQQWAALILLLAMLLFMAILGYGLMKWLVFDLVDEVWVCGNSILVKNGKVKRQFAFSDFLNLSYTGSVNPPRITLTLREPCASFGTDVSFIPPYRLFPYSTPPIAQDLLKRIDEAR